MSTLTNQVDHVSPVLLPVKVTPYIHESCNGYLMRLAAANGYPSPRWIADLEPILKRHGNHFKVAVEEALIRLVGLNHSETKFLERSMLRDGHVKYPHHCARVRMCPECVKTNKYLDYMWQITFASACPYHGIQLIDSCPECLCKLSWDRVHLELCKCGADLTEIRTIPADVRLLYYNTKLWAAMGRSVPQVTPIDIQDGMLSQLTLNKLCNIYLFMLRTSNNISENLRSRPSEVSGAVKAFEIIHQRLSEWPFGFYRYLDSFSNEDGGFNGEGLRQAFGSFYRRLMVDYFRPEFQFIKEAFEAYVRTRWIGVVDSKYTLGISHLRCGYTLIGEATRKFNVSRVRLNKLMDLGLIVGNRKPRPSGRNYTLLKCCEVTRFAKISKYAINKKETCRMLGISKREFMTLIEHKAIIPLVKAGDHGFLEWWCDSRKIKTFLEKIFVMVPKQQPGKNAISFSQVCQAHLTNVNLLPELLQSIIAGKTQVVGMDLDKSDGEFRLSSLYFDLNEIDRFRHHIKSTNTSVYSIPEAATMMGLKQEVMYHLVNAGFIKCHDDPTGFRKGRMMSLDDMVVFEKIYVPLAGIARSRNQCPRPLMIKLNRLGVSPAIGGGVDRCRQVFYRRSDLPESYKKFGFHHTWREECERFSASNK